MANTKYTDIGAVQAGRINFLGDLNDPNQELSNSGEIEAIYTMIGNEASSDIIRIAKLRSGERVSVRGLVAGNGIAAVATIVIGDTDTVGATVTADASRYSGAINVAADQTAGAGVAFSAGTCMLAPAAVTDDDCWLQAMFATLTSPRAGQKIVFRCPVRKVT